MTSQYPSFHDCAVCVSAIKTPNWLTAARFPVLISGVLSLPRDAIELCHGDCCCTTVAMTTARRSRGYILFDTYPPPLSFPARSIPLPPNHFIRSSKHGNRTHTLTKWAWLLHFPTCRYNKHNVLNYLLNFTAKNFFAPSFVIRQRKKRYNNLGTLYLYYLCNTLSERRIIMRNCPFESVSYGRFRSSSFISFTQLWSILTITWDEIKVRIKS